MPQPARIFLVDGSGLLYRAHFAFLRNPLVTSSGENVSAVFGLLSTLLRVLREESPAGLAVAFDVGGPTFRHELYPQYKATRPPTPPELLPQIPRAKEHHQDWLHAIRTGGQAGSDFSYGGPLTEIAMLGVIAIKLLGTKLEWDAERVQFTNCAEADQYINPPYRKGWSL